MIADLTAAAPEPTIVSTPESISPPKPTATLTSPATPAEDTNTTAQLDLPFVDDFDNGPSPAWEFEIGTWIVSNGELTIADINDWTRGVAWVGDTTWRNYQVEIDVFVPYVDSYDQNRAEILIRAQDNSNYFSLTFYDKSAEVGNKSGAAWYIVQDDERSDIPNTLRDFPRGETVTVRIEVNGSSVTTFFNNEQSSSWFHPNFQTGRIGLEIGSRTPGTTSTFDNLRVEPLQE
jgi:hypothetical protein